MFVSQSANHYEPRKTREQSGENLQYLVFSKICVVGISRNARSAECDSASHLIYRLLAVVLENYGLA